MWDRQFLEKKDRQTLCLFREVREITDEEEKVKKPLEINVHENVIISEFVDAARFYKKHFKVLVLVIVIMVILPITGYCLGGILGIIIGGPVCGIVVFLLAHRATGELLNLMKHK